MTMFNKTLEALAAKATEYVNSQPRHMASSLWEIKFAELIVKECVSICENSEIPFDIEVWRDSTKKEMTALTAIALGNLIKEHFGVK